LQVSLQRASCVRKLGFVFGLWAVLLSSMADAQSQWRTYLDPRFGMSIEYPSHLFTTLEVTAEGVTMLGAGVQFDLMAQVVDGINTAEQLQGLIQNTEGYEEMTYRAGGNLWLVVSGFRGDDIYYEKFFLTGGSVQGFSMQYPRVERRTFDAIVERMEDSFRPCKTQD
jgi:hypothetical protein